MCFCIKFEYSSTNKSSLCLRPLRRPLSRRLYLWRCSSLYQLNSLLEQNLLTQTNLNSHAVPARKARFAQQGLVFLPRRRILRHLVRQRFGNDAVERLVALALVGQLGLGLLQSLEQGLQLLFQLGRYFTEDCFFSEAAFFVGCA
jgi:hypothetical protein